MRNQGRWLVIATRTLIIGATGLLSLLVSPASARAQQSEGVHIGGDCAYDQQLGAVVCTYSAASYVMAPVRVYFPVPESCIDSVEITSPCLEFEGPAEYCSDACGDFFGYRSGVLPEPAQEFFFTVIYHGATENYLGILTIAAGGGGYCVSHDLPGVIGCYEEPYCEWSFDATEAGFYLRKPGEYAGRWCNVTLESNIDMSIHFSGFENLMPSGIQGVAIPVWHNIGAWDSPAPPPGWFTAEEFNEQVVNVDAQAEITQFSIWSRVRMTNQTTVGEYSDEATITVVLENNRAWIDIGEPFSEGGSSHYRRAGDNDDMVLK